MYCSKCGNQINQETGVCASCTTYQNPAQAQVNQPTNNIPIQPQRTPEYIIVHDEPPSNSSAPTTITDNDSKENKIWACLSYFGILFFLPLIFCPNSKFGKFHANQGLLLLLMSLCLSIGGAVINSILGIIPIIGYLLGKLISIGIWILVFSLAVKGAKSANKGETNELPLIGKYRIIKEDKGE